MEKRNRILTIAAALILAGLSVWIGGCGDDDENVMNPPGIDVPDYFWESRTPLQFSDFQGVGAAEIDTVSVIMVNDLVFGEGDPVRNTIVSFDGGEVWQFGPVLSDTTFRGLERIGDTIFAIGDENFYLSTDGLNWTPARWLGGVDSLGCGCELADIVKGAAKYVAPARRFIAHSNNGFQWEQVSRPTITDDNVFFNSVAYDGSLFYVLGNNFTQSRSDIYTSADGQEWELRASIPYLNLRDIAFFDQKFVVVGEAGVMLASTDAVSWTSVTLETVSDLIFVSRGNNELIAGGTDGTLLISRNLSDWDEQRIPRGSERTILGAYWNGVRYIAAGENLILVTSIPD